MSRHRAFTLIELMVAIAVLTIAVAIPWTAFQGAGGLKRQADYRFALRNAEIILDDLRAQKFETLSPIVRSVPDDGLISLPRQHIVPDSVQVTTTSGVELELLEVQSEQGIVKLSPAQSGKKVIVNFAYRAVDQGECHRVNDEGLIRLENRPVVAVTQVFLAKGDELIALSPKDWTLEGKTGSLQLDSSLSGRAVAVDYIGEAVGNVVRGEFLTENLESSEKPNVVKRFIVEETYGAGFRVKLSGLKVSP